MGQFAMRNEVRRSHNGPEYVGKVLLEWAAQRQITLIHIQPGNPQQNAYVERYNRTVRYDWLAQNLFENLEEVQQGATAWLWTYNNERPNMALGGITPKQKLHQHSLTLRWSTAKNGVIILFGTLKCELFYREKFTSIEQLEKRIHEYIYYYNHERVSTKLKRLSPVQYRNQSFL